MVVEDKEGILSEYRVKRSIYEEFSLTCEDLVRRLLRVSNIRVHSVTSRTKDIERLTEKLSRPDKNYEKLTDVTDLSGIRIITYFEDDVDKIGTLIESEFKVFPDKSLDKRKALDPDRFGYLSLHYVCTLSDERLTLSEYSAFRDYICEIQIRTILQHAWAEIEHDLGYKAPQGIPESVQRRFSRLASLLETGDEEFKNIRDELETYAVSVKKEIPVTPSKVLIDRVSLMAYVEQDAEIRKLDQTFAEYMKAELEDMKPIYADSRVEELQYVGIKTIEELQSAIRQKKDIVISVLKERLKSGSTRSISRGIGIFYLVQVLIADSGDVDATAKALLDLHIATPKRRTELAKILIDLVREHTKN